MKFEIESFYNPHLNLGMKRIDAIVSVTSQFEGFVTNNSAMEKAIVFVLDVSGSMIGGKLQMGKSAICRCIEMLDENSKFSVITFQNKAKLIVPMTNASTTSKKEALRAINTLIAGGGTEMSKGLNTALEQIRGLDNTLGFVQFVTDGDNNPADYNALERVLKECEGKFQCNCWGVGTDWRPDELRKISSSLLGSAEAVPNPEDLEAHFRSALSDALSKGVGDVYLRIQLPKTSKLVTVKQMSPEIQDLMMLTKKIDEKNVDVPIGSWGEESRDYQLGFELQPQDEGEEMMACRTKIVYSVNGREVVVDGQRIIATWTSDESLTARINPQVAHYTGQEELANSIKEGLEAKSRGDIDEATMLLGKAVKIAVESGNEEVTMRLKKVVDVVDVEQGTVRLKSGNNKAADLELDMGGTRTIRKRRNNG